MESNRWYGDRKGMETMDVRTSKVPPQNIEAEQSVLGAILLENGAMNKALEILSADDFYKESHRKIFLGMIELSEKNEPIDLVTLVEHLRRKDELERVGGAVYLASMVHFVPTSANVRHHSKIVHEKSLLRRLIATATDIVTAGYDGDRDVEDLLDTAENAIFGISEKKVRPSFVSVKDIVRSSVETIETLYERKERVTGVPTGFTDVDEQTSGLQPSDLVIVAGRPSMGKTAFCLGIAQHVGTTKKIPVAVFSLEMSKEQLVIRMLCSEARVDAHKLRSGYLGKSDWPKLMTAAGRLSEAPIFIDDSAGLSVLEMKAKARRLKAEHGLGLIIVDYLQLMRGRGSTESREQEISDISRSLKGLAKELRVPVIALSQLNRAVESRQDKRPQLADLRESGSIEQDADVVMFIYREEVYRKDKEDVRGIAEIIIGKQRNGPVGTVSLAFIDRYTRFDDLDRKHVGIVEE